MILGVNGIRLVGKRSGVGRCIEALINCFADMDHPFQELRVYSPAPIANDIVLPCCARNVVLPSLLPLGAWEQFTLIRAHGDNDLLFCPSYVVPILARCPTFLNSPRVVRRLPTGIQLVGFEQGAGRVFDECKPSDRSVYRQRTQQARDGSVLRNETGADPCCSGRS